jgi:hypothetical protein
MDYWGTAKIELACFEEGFGNESVLRSWLSDFEHHCTCEVFGVEGEPGSDSIRQGMKGCPLA